MVEIIPNWHPIFVHFTVALLSLTVVFHLLARLLSQARLQRDWMVLAKWSLWLGAAFALATAYTGWLAYNSVAHDAPSHVAMTDHRNWALATLSYFVAAALWSLWRERARERPSWFLAAALVLGGGLLAGTAWRGGELVYRHGLGVMSLPQTGAHQHGADHEHAHQAHDEHGHLPEQHSASGDEDPLADHSAHTH